MGQQASSVEQAAVSTPRHGGFCCGALGSPQDKPSKSKDSVVVQLEADGGLAAPQEAFPEVGIQRKKPKRPESYFGCGLGLASAPEVEVSEIRSRRASVGWTSPKGKPARKFHIDVLRLPAAAGSRGAARKAEQGLEVAFFEADGADNSFELPEGTLERAGGPYRVEVIAESGTLDRPRLSHPGCSAAFYTPAEPPSPVTNLSLAEAPGEHEFQVQWGPPTDDGGSKVEVYEVTLQVLAADGGCEDESPSVQEAEESPLLADEGGQQHASMESAEEAPTVWGLSSAANTPTASEAPVAARECTQSFRTKTLSHTFADLPAGSGPYRVEVRAWSEAGLLGQTAVLRVSTAVAAPKVPTGLRARLLPGWPYCGDGGLGTPRGSLEELGASDVDIVRLEFRAPLEDGGRPLESYLIYTAEENEEDLSKEDLVAITGKQQPSVRKPGSAPVCAVAAADAAGPGQMAPGCPCACDVAVEPNRAYTFSVEASNGTLRSGPCEPAPSVFVPARVPLPPRGPPEVFRVEGGFAAELRWVGPINAGGMPLHYFKVGILGPVADAGASSVQDCVGVGDVQREVTVSCAAAVAAAGEGRGGISWTPLVQAGPNEALYGARVEGLQASAKYRFVLASSNAVGTGRWSKPSSPVWTPVAAPATPVTPVATITVDKLQRVMVTVTWECGRNQAGSGSTAAFHVTLTPAQPAAAAGPSEQKTLRERVVATACAPGRRVSWAHELSHPGHYTVEIVAESSAGQRSPPAVLSLDVRPEAFPNPPDAAPDAPHWAEEPVLVLGPTCESEAQFGDFDPGTWLQALLLWHDSDPNPFSAKAKERAAAGSPIDVICCFRRPGSSDAHAATLATGVTASRLQVALPAHVPMSLRLVVRNEQSGSGPSDKPSKKERPAAKVQSEPLLLLMSEGSEHLKPVWEVWSRNSPDGQPPRWRELPEMLQTVLEANWLEGQPRVAFEIQSGMEGDAGPLAPARYEMIFGDERQVQHSVRRVGLAGWNAKVRRSVRDGEGEDAAAPTMAADEQCIVCMERRRTHAFMHSDTGDGHLAVCAGCAEAYKAEAVVAGAARHVRNCPMCRRPFTALQRIYQ